MNQKELLNRAFPDPQIREDRIRLIASRFSEVLLLRYHNQIKSLGVKIQCARNKEEVEEVLYYIEESLIKRAAFLKSQGVATILEHVMSSFYVPDIDSEDYHYVFTNQSEEQKQSIRVIYDKYWDLVEEAIPSINRREQILIDVSEKNSGTWLSNVRFGVEKPYSGYTCEILLRLIHTDQFGSPVFFFLCKDSTKRNNRLRLIKQLSVCYYAI